MKHVKNGSTILLVVFITTAIITLSTMIWRSSMLSLDVALKRHQYEQLHKATEGLLNLGIALCKENKTKLKKKQQSYTCALSSWIQIDGTAHDGTITIAYNEHFGVEAVLKKADTPIFKFSCSLREQNDDAKHTYLIVDNWRAEKV